MYFFNLVASDGLYFIIHFKEAIQSNALRHTACRLYFCLQKLETRALCSTDTTRMFIMWLYKLYKFYKLYKLYKFKKVFLCV